MGVTWSSARRPRGLSGQPGKSPRFLGRFWRKGSTRPAEVPVQVSVPPRALPSPRPRRSSTARALRVRGLFFAASPPPGFGASGAGTLIPAPPSAATGRTLRGSDQPVTTGVAAA